MNLPALRRFTVSTGFWLAGLCLPIGFVHGSATADKSKYRGFTLDDSRVRARANLAAVRAATTEQIDIACAVGLPDRTLAFFQDVPFQIVPSDAIPSGSPGLYSGRSKLVEVTAKIVTVGHKPILLHEMLHAYHDQQLKGGYGNREILAFYARAKNIRAFAANSHMMKNEKEFFACAATTYLFGVTAQEPFQREKIKENQPEFFQYLKNLFGPEAGSYAGSPTH